MFYGLVVAVGVVVALSAASLPAGIALGLVVAAVVVATAFRLRFEVVPGEVRIGNFARTTRVPVGNIAAIGPQQINFRGIAGSPNGVRYRVIVSTTDVDKHGRQVHVPAIATERKSLEWVQDLVQASAQVAGSAAQQVATD